MDQKDDLCFEELAMGLDGTEDFENPAACSQEELDRLYLDHNIDNDLKLYLGDISKYPLLTVQEEKETARLVKAGDAKAREKLIVSNLRLVIPIARKYSNVPGVELMDLIQEGNIGLTKAVEKFDVEKGFKFSTYAVCWIAQGITRYVHNHFSFVYTPEHVAYRIAKIRHVIREAAREEGCTKLSFEEIAKRSGVSESFIRETSYLLFDPLSMDRPCDEEGTTFGDFLPDRYLPATEDTAVSRVLSQIVRKQVAALPEREREIISLRFGLNGQAPCTLEQIAKRYGLSRERIRQVEREALDKLQRREVMKDLADELASA